MVLASKITQLTGFKLITNPLSNKAKSHASSHFKQNTWGVGGGVDDR